MKYSQTLCVQGLTLEANVARQVGGDSNEEHECDGILNKGESGQDNHSGEAN